MKKRLLSKSLTCIALAMLASGGAYSQEIDTAKAKAYESLSLKDLLNVKIVSVSKQSELLFDAPLSASVITRENIRKAGATSIMEALRLVPGMIVREESNGNYDIHLRGMDNVPPNAAFDVTSNTTTLVMIDNRPIYSYFKGGTFWETLPVDLNDVEKIEVVRGPAAALYGPNAVNGVINIITRQTKKDGLYLVANTRMGSLRTQINNASVGYQAKKWNVIASGNYQRRERSQTSYFEYDRNQWLDHPDYFFSFLGDSIADLDKIYPNQQLAMEKYAGNLFGGYTPSEDVKFNLSTGIQHSMVQRISTDNTYTPLSTLSSDSRYIDFRASVKGVSGQVSYNRGTQANQFDAGNKYDFNTLDANIEYNYTKDNFSLKPGLSYRSAIYDDTKYSDTVTLRGIFNTRGKMTTASAFLRADYKLLSNKLRLVAGLTASKFNYPDTTYVSYEFAATYKLNKKNLFRAVYSQSPRSASVYDAYVNQTLIYFETSPNRFTRLALQNNRTIKLLTANMFEIGYRGSITSGLSIDVELFNIRAKNFSNLIYSRPYIQLNGIDTVKVRPIISTNIPLILLQQGITVSLTYTSRKFQAKPFITIQHTKMKDYAQYNNTPDSGPLVQNSDPVNKNIYSGMGTRSTLQSTPDFFGGASVNYTLSSKINVSLNAYYYGNQTYYHRSNIQYNDGIRGIDHIPAKLILNTNISYEVVKGLHFFCTGKNILNDRSHEFFKTDATPFMWLAGINYEF
jgi:iron complex outermembrane receptor protein